MADQKVIEALQAIAANAKPDFWVTWATVISAIGMVLFSGLLWWATAKMKNATVAASKAATSANTIAEEAQNYNKRIQEEIKSQKQSYSRVVKHVLNGKMEKWDNLFSAYKAAIITDERKGLEESKTNILKQPLDKGIADIVIVEHLSEKESIKVFEIWDRISHFQKTINDGVELTGHNIHDLSQDIKTFTRSSEETA